MSLVQLWWAEYFIGDSGTFKAFKVAVRHEMNGGMSVKMSWCPGTSMVVRVT
jgi:hypothetical protein